MDIATLPTSQNGNRYVVTVTDLFTKHVKLFPVPNQTAVTVTRCFFEHYINFGIPETVLTDQGSQFQSALLQELCQLMGIDKRRSTPYMPSDRRTHKSHL